MVNRCRAGAPWLPSARGVEHERPSPPDTTSHSGTAGWPTAAASTRRPTPSRSPHYYVQVHSLVQISVQIAIHLPGQLLIVRGIGGL